MASTPRSTRSRTRALRRFSGDKPKLDTPPSPGDDQTEDANIEGASSPENDNVWEDVSDEEGDASAKSAQSNSSTAAVRRTSGAKARRRKRVGGIQTPTRRQTPVFATAMNNSNPNTPMRQMVKGKPPSEEVQQLEALREAESTGDNPVPPEGRGETPYEENHVLKEESPVTQPTEDEPSDQEQSESRKEKTPSGGTLKVVDLHENESNGHTHTNPPKRGNSMPKISTEEIVDTAVQGVSYGSWYIFDVVRTALALLRKPLGLVLFLWMLATILLAISHTLRTAFAPLCWLPVVSTSVMCRPLPLPPQGADYPRLVEAQTRTFEQLLDETSGGSALSLEVKKAEMATSDLVTVVRISTMRAKDTLADMLSEFVQDAKKTARRLHRLHSKVGGSVDSIMAVNDHALLTIGAANSKDTLFDTLIPWKQSRKNQVVASTFKDAMDTLSAQISRLVLEAEVNIENLNDLEERLNGIHELVSREVKSVKVDREELLAQLWTILGGNRKELKNFNENLVTLLDIGKYRQQARMHVTATLQTLHSLSEDMEELRERVATPGLVGESIPLEVQMKSIQYGLDRLKENRIKARRTHDAAVQGVIGQPLDGIEG